MGIEARCGHCGADYLLADHLAGKTVRCKRCGQAFTVPAKLDELEVVETPQAPAASPPPDLRDEGFAGDAFGDDPDHGYDERTAPQSPPELRIPPRDVFDPEAQTRRDRLAPEVEALLAPGEELELTSLEPLDEPITIEPPPEQPIAFDILDIAGPSGGARTWFLIILAIAILCLVHPLSAKYAMWAMLVIGGIWTLAGMIFWIKEAFRWGYEPVKLFIPFHPVFWTIQHVRLVPDSTAAVLRGLVLLAMALPLWLVAQTAR